MAELRELMADCGFPNAATHLQSGNVLFGSDKCGHELASLLADAVHDRYGYDITVVMRSAADIARIVANMPFRSADEKSSGVVFMTDTPTHTPDTERFAPDRLVVAGSDIYVDLPTGFGKTKLTVDWIERHTESLGTRRNWKTVLALHDKLSDLAL